MFIFNLNVYECLYRKTRGNKNILKHTFASFCATEKPTTPQHHQLAQQAEAFENAIFVASLPTARLFKTTFVLLLMQFSFQFLTQYNFLFTQILYNNKNTNNVHKFYSKQF